MNKITLTIIGLLIIVLSIVSFTKIDRDTSGQPNAQKEQINDNGPVISEISTDNIVDLSNKGLNQIPSFIFDRTNIEELDVSNNSLTGSIQAEIRHLKNLKILNASNNNMTGVPAEIGQLDNLEILNLSNNQITGLPYELGNLKNLKILDLTGNKYSTQDLNTIRKTLPQTVNIITD